MLNLYRSYYDLLGNSIKKKKNLNNFSLGKLDTI